MLTQHRWTGRWPTDEYPPDGAQLQYRKTSCVEPVGPVKGGVVESVWCGIEPVIVLTNGESLFTWDEFEMIDPPSAPGDVMK